MKAQELNDTLLQQGLTGGYTTDSDKYVIPSKIRYALVISLQDPSLAEEENTRVPFWIQNEAQSMLKANERFAHQYDPVPRNKTIAELMQEYAAKGTKIPARVELKKRVEYVSFDEQKQVLCAFLINNAVDRKFALKFLDGHWDEFYAPDVERAWKQHRDKEAAVVIVHHFPQEFVYANRFELTEDYNYLQVRLRLPATSAIDQSQLSDSAFLYLCARLSIDVSDERAEIMFYQNVLNAIGSYYIKAPWNVHPHWVDEDHFYSDKSLCDIPTISSMVWSLGMLGKTEILIRFTSLHKKIYPLIMQSKWNDVRTEFDLLGLEFDYLKYDEAVMVYEQRIIEKNRPTENAQMNALPDSIDLSNFTLGDYPNDPF